MERPECRWGGAPCPLSAGIGIAAGGGSRFAAGTAAALLTHLRPGAPLTAVQATSAADAEVET